MINSDGLSGLPFPAGQRAFMIFSGNGPPPEPTTGCGSADRKDLRQPVQVTRSGEEVVG
jgi:hypothetical protein